MILILFYIIASVSSSTLTNDVLENIRQSGLKAHNDFRANHGTPALVMDNELNDFAQNFVQYLADNRLFFHSPESKRGEIGENLYYRCQAPAQPNITKAGIDAAEAWYSEIQMYNFDDPKYSYKTGHFTALVWSSSTKIGLGAAVGTLIKNNVLFNCVYVCANYLEPGNINFPDIFEDNVAPPLD